MRRKTGLLMIVLFLFVCYLIGNNNSFSIYREVLNSKIYLSLVDPTNGYEIRYMSNGGNETYSPIYKQANELLGNVNEPTRTDYNFIGWYTSPDNNNGTKVDAKTIVTGNATYYAHWAKIVCKKAVAGTLHQEECQANGGCTKIRYTTNGTHIYTVGDVITYGTLSGSTAPVTSNAYDCDVNNDGTYDYEHERFYFMRSYESGDNQNEVLVHYTSYDINGQMDSSSSRENYEYEDAKNYLPDSSVWSNPALISFDSKVSRFISITDIEKACGEPISQNDNAYLQNCQYLMETSRFQAKALGRAGIWVEKTNGDLYRIQTEQANFQIPESTTSKNTVRPVIEIPFENIEGYNEPVAYSITYNTNGGEPISYTYKYEDETLGTLPTPVKGNATFQGWYSDSGFNTPVDATTVVTGNMTLYAKWEDVNPDLEYVFHIPGKCEFNGASSNITSSTSDCISTINPTNNNIDYTASANKYINTGISLYSEANYEKDYEIGFTIENYNSASNQSQATLMNTKLENSGLSYPGLTFRRKDKDTAKLQVTEKIKGVTGEADIPITNPITDSEPLSIVIERKSGVISYSINGGAMTPIQTITEADYFNMTTWFGAGSGNASASATTSTAQRHFVGTLSNMYIKLDPDNTPKYQVTFDAGDGTTSFATKNVKRGNNVGILPTATNPGYYFDGWYTSSGTKIDTTTKITSNTTFYAHYKDIYVVTFDATPGTASTPNIFQIVDGESVGTSNLPTAELANKIFDGWYTSGGTKIDGTEPITQDTTYYARYLTKYTVTFDAGDGTASFGSKEVGDGKPVGELPTAENPGYVLGGWFTDNTWTTEVTENTIITGDVTFVANWIDATYAAKVNGQGYTTLASAIASITTSNQTTIYILHDIDGENVTIPANMNVILDIQQHTLSADSGIIITNKGTLEIKNGSITRNGSNDQNRAILNDGGTLTISSGTITHNSFQAIQNKGTMYITGGLITIGTTVGQGVINNESGATLTMSGGEIKAYARQAIYNVGTKVTIEGDAILSNGNSPYRATLQSTGGQLIIKSGTITSGGYSAVLVTGGSLTIGTEDDEHDVTSPYIQGNKKSNNGTAADKGYGVKSTRSFTFYDGIIKGTVAAVSDESKITGHEANATKVNDTETIGTDTFYTLYYQTAPKYVITLDARGGIISNNEIQVTPGHNIGAIPTPSKGVYTFDGWYDLATDQLVDDNTIPQGNMDLYASWTYTPTHENFDIINEPMKNYFNYISTWSANQATFQTNMDNNFNAYGCLECNSNYQSCPTPTSSSILCDKPKGFNTGLVNGSITVYESDATTKAKGANEATDVTVRNGVIYNMTPGKTYYWELDSDPSVYGTITASGERRIIDADTIRNVRDLGGLEVDVDGDGTPDGRLKYGILFRGPKLTNSTTDIDALNALHITEEIDLRGSTSEPQLSNYVPRQIVNYEVDKANYPNNYNMLKDALTATMQDVNAGNKIYFHCAIGTDRTGTLAYFLEGLLGVSEEDRLQDYELSYFYGLLNRHRFYNNQPGSSITHRFDYMHNLYDTNQKIYNYYTDNNPTQAEIDLINTFRNNMIDYY